MDVFAVIPARGGSKRVPRKNVREVGGKPLIAHTIGQATSATTIDRCIVSTDDDEIAAVAREYGGNVPFKRPPDLATDEATSPPVIAHALDWVEEQGESPHIIVMLQVTTPLRDAQDIDNAIMKLRGHEEATSVVSISEFGVPPHWALEKGEDNLLKSYFDREVFWTEDIPRSQDLPTLFHPNGAVFAAEVPAFKKAQNFYTEKTIGYEMPRERSIDIDEPHDLKIVQKILE